MIFLKRTFAQIVLSFSDITNWQDQVYYILFSIMKLAPIAFILSGLNIWFKDNTMFFSFIIFALIINMLAGIIRHKLCNTFSWEEFFTKNIVMWLVIILSYPVLEMLRYIAGDNIVSEGFKIIIQVATFLYPGSKILKNVYIISNGQFPSKFIMEGLYKFEQTGNTDYIFNRRKKEEDEDFEDYSDCNIKEK